MKTVVCFLLLIIGGFLSLSFQEQNLPWICWSENKKLTWDDFKGAPDYTSTFGANSNTDINYPERKTKDSVTFTVKAMFSPEFSWVKSEAIKNREWDTLGIIHENKHFDITEIYARKLRKIFSETHFTNDELLNGESDRIADSINTLHKQEQSLYDEETKHGMDKEKQKEWNLRIAKELLEWNAFRKETVTVFLKR